MNTKRGHIEWLVSSQSCYLRTGFSVSCRDSVAVSLVGDLFLQPHESEIDSEPQIYLLSCVQHSECKRIWL